LGLTVASPSAFAVTIGFSQVGYEGDSGGLLLILFIVLQRSLLSSFRLRGVA